MSAAEAAYEPDVVSFVTTNDLLIIRFAQLLAAASENKMIFSSRIYGHLIGQLPTSTSTGSAPSSVPTNASNFDDRIFLSMLTGSYAVEYALILYKTSSYKALQRLSLFSIISNSILLSLFVELVVSLFAEIRINAGTRFTSLIIMRDVATTRAFHLATASKIASEPLSEAEDGSLNAITQTLDVNTDPLLSLAETEQYTKLQTKSMPALQHLLRMCMDATLVKEEAFMLKKYADGSRQHIWDIPDDTPPDALLFHLRGPLIQTILFSLAHIQLIGDAVYKSNNVRKFNLSSECLQWLLDDRMRSVLFANMAACHYHTQLASAKALTIKGQLISRMRITYNDLTCWFATAIDKRAPVDFSLIHRKA